MASYVYRAIKLTINKGTRHHGNDSYIRLSILANGG